MSDANEVLEFWFGVQPLDPARIEERSRFWFGGDGAEAQAERDAMIAARLGPMLERAARGELDSWAGSPKRRLALILLFDQVPRNVHRGSAAAFACDARALALAAEGLQLGADGALHPLERIFFYLPLEHAESLEAQDASIAAFDRLVAEATPEFRDYCANTREYALRHREVIQQFGRFPARNAALGRVSTPPEGEYLLRHPHGFG